MNTNIPIAKIGTAKSIVNSNIRIAMAGEEPSDIMNKLSIDIIVRAVETAMQIRLVTSQRQLIDVRDTGFTCCHTIRRS